MSEPMTADQMRRGAARLMVRHHLSDLIRPDIGTEDQIVALFVRCMQAQPDAAMRDVVTAFRQTVNRYLLERACRVPPVTIRTLDGGGE